MTSTRIAGSWAPTILAALVLTSCGGLGDPATPPYDVEFEVPRTEAFAEELSAYGLFLEPIAGLQPAQGVYLYELSSELFTDYAYKQRLLSVPEGTSITVGADDRLEYPEGTILAKTFSYPEDMRDPTGPRRLIETRLLIKTQGVWNVATYVWNAQQTDATLLLEGAETQVSWIDPAGDTQSTNYLVPHEGECVTCHQDHGESAYIGPTLRNLNRSVVRNGDELGQLEHLQAAGVIEPRDWSSAPDIPDYDDENLPLETRARAYLDINCAHCHNPAGWGSANEREFDFRYATPFIETGIAYEEDKVAKALERGEMPYMGTTVLHDEGVELLLSYIESL